MTLARAAAPRSASVATGSDARRLLATFHTLLLALTLALCFLPTFNGDALSRALVLIVPTLLLWRTREGSGGVVVLALVEVAFVGALVPGSGAERSPLLPFLLAPALALGVAGGWRQVLLGALLGSVTMLGVQSSEMGAAQLPDFAASVAQWVLLGVAVGVIGSWAGSLAAEEAGGETIDRYAEARELLQQLRAVTRRMPGGLDARSAAEALLDVCRPVAPYARAAVLVQPAAGPLVPLAVRGMERVPWRAPVTEAGPLAQAWARAEPTIDRRAADDLGRRRGGVLAVLPLLSGDESFGLVVLESFDQEALPETAVARAWDLLREPALRLQTALLFDEVRLAATAEERDRLAREMHDGIAQDIASIGYELDALRATAARTDAALATGVQDVRERLTGLVSDIRLSITDLRSSLSAERGLGAALSNYLRSVTAGKQVAVHLSLEESTFRLPSQQEVALYEIAQAVAQDARRSAATKNVWVALAVDPPSARLTVEHDGVTAGSDNIGLSAMAEALRRVGGTMTATARHGSGLRVVAVLEGEARCP